MAKIHWSAYIIIGLFISVSSYYFNYEKLVFFFYFGLVFVLAGILKLAFGISSREGKKEQKQVQQATKSIQHPHQFKRCHVCGNAVRIHNMFCGRCGTKV